jgi:hypothetical protein
VRPLNASAALHPLIHRPLIATYPPPGLLCTYFIPETTGMSLETISDEDVPRHVKGAAEPPIKAVEV